MNTKGLKLPQKRQLKLPPKKVFRPVLDNGVKEWFYIGDNGKECGPCSIHGLRGMITRDTLVWKEGFAEWQRAGDTTELSSMLATVKPAAPAASYKGLFELLAALSPFIVVAGSLLAMCGIIVDFNVSRAWHFAWLALVVCFILDNHCRKKTGQGEGFSGVDWFMLIIAGPVVALLWMISRARHITHKFLPPILFISGIVLAIVLASATANGRNLNRLNIGEVSAADARERLVAMLLEEKVSENFEIKKDYDIVSIQDIKLTGNSTGRYSGTACVLMRQKEDGYTRLVPYVFDVEETATTIGLHNVHIRRPGQ